MKKDKNDTSVKMFSVLRDVCVFTRRLFSGVPSLGSMSSACLGSKTLRRERDVCSILSLSGWVWGGTPLYLLFLSLLSLPLSARTLALRASGSQWLMGVLALWHHHWLTFSYCSILSTDQREAQYILHSRLDVVVYYGRL